MNLVESADLGFLSLIANPFAFFSETALEFPSARREGRGIGKRG